MDEHPHEQSQQHKVLTFALAGIAILLIVSGVYYLTTRPESAPSPEVPSEEEPVTPPPASSGDKTYTLASGLSFMYPDSYVAIAPEMLEMSAEEIVNLFDADDYRELEASTEPREGPVSISVQVFDNPNRQSAGEWIQSHAAAVNYDDALGRLQPREVAGEDGVAYRFTGLYEGDATAFTANGKVYLFTVTWMGPNDQIREDFEDILNSISTP